MFGVRGERPVPFYYLCLAVAAIAYSAVVYAAAFALRPGADGSRGTTHAAPALSATTSPGCAIAAFFFAGLIAGAAGVLYVWFNGRISPAPSASPKSRRHPRDRRIGGMRHPIGPFLGAALYVLLKTFAIDIVGADRFKP